MKSIYEYIVEAFNALEQKKIGVITKRLFNSEGDDVNKYLSSVRNNFITNKKREFNLSNSTDRKSFFNLFGGKSLSKYKIDSAEALGNLASLIRGNIESWLNDGGLGKGFVITDKVAEQIRKKEQDFETRKTEAINTIDSMFDVEEGTNKVDDLKKYDKDSKDVIVCRSILYPEIPCLFFVQKKEDIDENGKVKIQDVRNDIDYYYLDFLYDRYGKKDLRYMFAETKYGFGYASRWYPVACYYDNFVKNPNPTESEFNNEDN